MKKTTACLILILAFIFTNINQARSDEKKDHFKAFLMSLVIPGSGQFYAGSPGYAKIFIASELAILGSYYYNTIMKDASRQDYLSQAALYAGVNPSGLGSRYLNAIGAYNSSYDYNKSRLQINVYHVLYTQKMAWEWDIEEHRLRFRNFRERELDYKNNVKYCIAGIVLNHFLSALNASKLVQNENRSSPAVTLNVLNEGMAVNYSRRF